MSISLTYLGRNFKIYSILFLRNLKERRRIAMYLLMQHHQDSHMEGAFQVKGTSYRVTPTQKKAFEVCESSWCCIRKHWLWPWDHPMQAIGIKKGGRENPNPKREKQHTWIKSSEKQKTEPVKQTNPPP